MKKGLLQVATNTLTFATCGMQAIGIASVAVLESSTQA